MGEKQIRFPGFMELCALHPKRYSPDKKILEILNVNQTKNMYCSVLFPGKPATM